jgi:hypothetical protein
MCDLRFTNHGSIVTMVDAGEEWVATVSCEPRYLEDIVLGARADGLICEG